MDSQLLWRVIIFPLKHIDVHETTLQQSTVQSYSARMLLFKDYASVMNHTLNHYFMCLEIPS